MTTAIVPQTRTQINRIAPQVAPDYDIAFTYREWQAMSNGMLCGMMGHTGRELEDARKQWPKSQRQAWDLGYTKVARMMDRADVAWALVQRFSGEEV